MTFLNFAQINNAKSDEYFVNENTFVCIPYITISM